MKIILFIIFLFFISVIALGAASTFIPSVRRFFDNLDSNEGHESDSISTSQTAINTYAKKRNDLWQSQGLSFDGAVKDFSSLNGFEKPTNEKIAEIKDDWGLDGDTADNEMLRDAEFFTLVVSDQNFSLTFEAYKPGRYVNCQEVIEFIFNHAADMSQAEKFNAVFKESNVIDTINWSVDSHNFQHTYSGDESVIDVDWTVEVANQALESLGSPDRCFRSDVLDDRIILLVGHKEHLHNLLEKYSL